MAWAALVMIALVQSLAAEPPVEEVDRAMAAAKAALSVSSQKAREAQKEEEEVVAERKALQRHEAEEKRWEQEESLKMKKERAKLEREREEVRAARESAEEEIRGAKSASDEARKAQQDAKAKLSKSERLHRESESMLKRAAADDDEAARVETEARQNLNQADQDKEDAVGVYQNKEKQAEAAKAEAGKQEARARVATRRYEAELESLQAEQKSLAKDKGKLQDELAEVEHARHQVLGALAEAKNATRVAAKEEAKAAQQKLESQKKMEKAKRLMSVAQEMHDVAEQAMVAAEVLQEGGATPRNQQAEPQAVGPSGAEDPEKAMSAAVGAAASAQKQLHHVEKQLATLHAAKAQQARDLEAKERELLDTMEDLERARSMERNHQAALKSALGYERTEVLILQVTLVLVSLAFALWAYSRWLPAPVKLTEEKAIDQSPLSRLVDVEVQADAKEPKGSPLVTPRMAVPFGLDGAVHAPERALPSRSGPRLYYMSPRAKEEEALKEPLLEK